MLFIVALFTGIPALTAWRPHLQAPTEMRATQSRRIVGTILQVPAQLLLNHFTVALGRFVEHDNDVVQTLDISTSVLLDNLEATDQFRQSFRVYKVGEGRGMI